MVVGAVRQRPAGTRLRASFALGDDAQVHPGRPSAGDALSILLEAVDIGADGSGRYKVDFLARDLARAYLRPGADVLVMEGPTIVGRATIHEVVRLNSEARDTAGWSDGSPASPTPSRLVGALRESRDTLRCAYPTGVPGEDYMALLAELSNELSEENVAIVIAELIDGDREVVANDAAAALSTRPPDRYSRERVREGLSNAGWRRNGDLDAW